MKPEAAAFIAYARRLLHDATTMVESGLSDHAARTAYLACFHTARAYIFERTDHLAKTHKGVQIEFARLTKDDLALAPDLRAFLSRAYAYKAMADYETSVGDTLNGPEARDVIEIAERFVAWFGR